MAIPTAPQNPVVIRSADRTSALFTWDSVTASPAVTGYTIYASRSMSVTGYIALATITAQNTPAQYAVVDSLEANTVYAFYIAATNGTEGAASEVIQDF